MEISPLHGNLFCKPSNKHRIRLHCSCNPINLSHQHIAQAIKPNRVCGRVILY